jgi:hypothetical protein
MDKKLYLILGSINIIYSDPFEARSVATAEVLLPQTLVALNDFGYLV